MAHHHNESHNGTLLTGILLGGVIGAFAGLLAAPQKGSQTRRRLQSEAERRINDIINEFKEGIGEDIEKIVYEVRDSVTGKVDEAKDRAEDFRDEITGQAEDTKAKVKSKVTEVKNSAAKTARDAGREAENRINKAM